MLPAEVTLAYAPIAIARLRSRRGAPRVRQYWEDPAGWVHDRIHFPEGQGPTSYQDEALDAVGRHKRASVRGPHGLGKTAIPAWLMLWFIDTRERAGADWKVITTAGSWTQLRFFLWPEFHKWQRLCVPALGWREGIELLSLSVRLRHGQAFPVAPSRPELIEGAHADQVLYIYDEAKSIGPATFDASEGAFAGAGIDGREAYAWAGSTPAEPVGRFADIHHRRPGLDDWWPRHVTLAEAIAAGRISAEWAEQRKKQWGERSAVYQNRVLGEFAAEDAQSVIPLAWIEAAMDRWRALDGGYAPFTAVGVDVARYGEDRTVLALRYGDAIGPLLVYSKDETTVTTGRVVGILRAHRGYASVDVIGLGAGVVDQLREQGYETVAFNAAGRSEHKDRSGELGYVNRRSAAWWNLREMLDPGFESAVALPPDEELLGDLVTPMYRVVSGGRIAVESKDDIRKRLGRSTDKGDAVVQAFALPEPEDFEGVVVWEDDVPDIGGGF